MTHFQGDAELQHDESRHSAGDLIAGRGRLISLWLPVVVWMILIFIASSQISLPSVKIGVLDFAIKKSGHLFEYAVLGLLLFRACYGSAAGLASLRPAAAALVIGGMYAASDEMHQLFVPTRNGSARDVVIDLAAIILALALAWVWRRRSGQQRQP